jgi:hypothetical protein
MLRVALRVLAHRNPVALDDLSTFFGPPSVEADGADAALVSDVANQAQPENEVATPSRRPLPPEASRQPLGLEAGPNADPDDISPGGIEPQT